MFSFSQDVLLGDDSFIGEGAWYVALDGTYFGFLSYSCFALYIMGFT